MSSKLKKLVCGSDEKLDAYFEEARQRYNLQTYPLLASNRKANPAKFYTEPE